MFRKNALVEFQRCNCSRSLCCFKMPNQLASQTISTLRESHHQRKWHIFNYHKFHWKSQFIFRLLLFERDTTRLVSDVSAFNITDAFILNSFCSLNKSSAKNKSFSFAQREEGDVYSWKGAARDFFLCCEKNHLDIYYWYYTTLNIIIIFRYRSCCRFSCCLLCECSCNLRGENVMKVQENNLERRFFWIGLGSLLWDLMVEIKELIKN